MLSILWTYIELTAYHWEKYESVTNLQEDKTTVLEEYLKTTIKILKNRKEIVENSISNEFNKYKDVKIAHNWPGCFKRFWFLDRHSLTMKNKCHHLAV